MELAVRSLPYNLALGQAGVHAVAAQLLLHGISPCFPAVDIGADIVTADGIKVQVKSARIRHQKLHGKPMHRYGAYWFKLSTRIKVRAGFRITQERRIFSEECDFVVLWGVEDNKFWVVPAALLDGKTGCTVGRPAGWVDADIEAVREAREEGRTWREIASSLGLKLGTTFRSGRGARDQMAPRTRYTQAVRECEGRWDFILGASAALSQAEAAVSANAIPEAVDSQEVPNGEPTTATRRNQD